MADEVYKRFDELREAKGVTVYAVSKATGITTTTFTNWKKGKYTPKRDKMELISQYFNVSVDYLMNGKEYEFTSEIGEKDAALSEMSETQKDYALKLSQLSKENQLFVMEMIDRLKKGEDK